MERQRHLAILLGGFQTHAFRLEARQTYVDEDEAAAVEQFYAGELTPPPRDSAWSHRVSSHVQAGRRIRRVRVLSKPLTPYAKYELSWGYAPGFNAGEDIAISEDVSLLLERDFWLLDDRVVAFLDYDLTGRPLGMEVTENSSALEHAQKIRSIAENSAVPLRRYVANWRTNSGGQ